MTLVFCSLSCWEAHQADARHRDAGAEEARSPSAAAWAKELAEEQAKSATKTDDGKVEMKRVVGAASLDILVVASKLKDYIMGVLSDHLRRLCDQAIEAAARDGRRTLMDRDMLPLVTRGMESLATGSREADDRPDEVLVVVAKLKGYVKARAGMSTSDGVIPVLSAYLRRLARQAIRHAGGDDRKTVLDRDFAAAIAK